jgi:hypothetical protein
MAAMEAAVEVEVEVELEVEREMAGLPDSCTAPFSAFSAFAGMQGRPARGVPANIIECPIVGSSINISFYKPY